MVLTDGVVAKDQPVYRFGIQYGRIKCVEFVVLDRYTTMKIELLIFQVRYFGIDGNDCIGELEHIGERVDELVVADEYIVAGSGFEPSITIAAKQNGRAGSMVEQIMLDDGFARRAEQ